MQVPLYQALISVKVPAQQAEHVVDTVQEFIEMRTTEALKEVKTEITALKYIFGILSIVTTASGVLGGYLAVLTTLH